MPLTRLPTRTDRDRLICRNEIPHTRSLFSFFFPRPARGERPGVTGIFLLLAFLWLLPIPSMAQTTEQHATVLHLSQTAERKVVRDFLRIELRLEETGADPVALQSAINRRMVSALDRARQVQGVAVETGTYTVNQEEPKSGASRWRASQSLILTGKAADAVLKLGGTLQSAGLLMSSLGYEVSPETVRGAEEDLTAEALAGLDQRAASIADRMHLSVLRYRDLRVGNAETSAGPMPRFAAMAMAAPVAEPGQAEIRLTVSAELLLGAHH
jgi:predicted secreted protein